ncbi:MAG: acetyl-CoA C-acyltransferase, partial [Paracoccaceae bacterium]|nr:acetyl-CoA C-acyltransferase [Paracoccaceae bacterium]
MENVVICGAARTPIGGFQGAFDAVPAARLGGAAIEAALQQTSLSSVDEVVMGNVLGAGQGQAPARQASFHAGLGAQVPATTLNKMCGSGMKATMIGFDQIALGQTQVMAVGGMESMSNAPYLLPKMRSGARLGHSQVADHMFLDGLEDAYENGRLMGSFAEDCAEKYQFTREAQDDYALRSLTRAREAQSSGAFENEITPFNLARKKGDYAVVQDEQPSNAKPEKIPYLKPAFRADGSVTAANASSISDGAAALIVSSQTRMQQAG